MDSLYAYNLTEMTGITHLEYEEYISKDMYSSYFYALRVKRSRFELGEVIISKTCWYAYAYASCVIKGRFKLGESIMCPLKFSSKSVKMACYNYIFNILEYNHE